MGLKYKCDILELLKNKGYTTYKIRQDKLLSGSTVQKLRDNKSVSWENIETICRLLKCQPADILIFEDDQ